MKKNIDRKEFLKIMGLSAATVGLASTVGCKNNSASSERGGEVNREVPKDKMVYRNLPGIGDKVSLLAYGCMRWPTLKTKVPAGECKIDQEAVNELVDYAIEHGVTYFDTAPVYGQGWCEEVTGKALSRHPRESYHIAAKLSKTPDNSFERSIAMYKNTLDKLQTDYLDFYLLHNIGNDIELFRKRFIYNGVLDYLLEERKAGRIRRLGWSFHGLQENFDEILAMHEEVHWDFIMIQINYADWYTDRLNPDAEYLYNEITKRNIPIAVMEPLLGGRLNKLPEHIVDRLQEREPENSVASWAFRFVASRPNVFTVLSGMTMMEHLQDNIRTYSPLKPLNDDEEKFLEETAKLIISYPTVACNDCQYCMPCPYNLDIPAILLHYNRCVNEGRIIKSKSDDDYTKNRRAYLIGYDRSVPKLRQASMCIGCGKCIPICPQKINIPKELERINSYIEKLKQGVDLD